MCPQLSPCFPQLRRRHIDREHTTPAGRQLANVAAAVQAAAFDDLDAPIERVGAPFTPVPLSPPLEDAYLPDSEDVYAAARATLGR